MAVDYTKLLDGNSLKAIRSYIISNFQPLHSNLTSISALATNVTGLIKMTNGVASLDGTTYAPLASPSFTGTVVLPTSVKIGSSTATGLVKYTNGVLSIDTNSYLTSHLYRPVQVGGTQRLANTSNAALNFANTGNVTFSWSNSSVVASVDLSTYLTKEVADETYQPLAGILTAISGLTSGATGGYNFLQLQPPGGTGDWNAKLVTLQASDIPSLDASKITSGTFADARIASAATWNAKYTKPSGGIPASDLAESYIKTSARGAANGVASLGSDGKVPTSQLPDSVLSGMEYKGTFDASSGSTISGLEKGWYYICSTAGSKNPDGTAGPSEGYEVGDWAVYNGSTDGWSKIDNSDKVSSVNGKTGVVILSASDVSALPSSTKYAKSLSVSGRTVTLKDQDGTTLSTITTQDTTYESKAAASGGTAVSLVTTGEKYTWNNKQNALATQTAYSAKGSSTKVPQITTNTLGQVTGITEVDIDFPTLITIDTTVGSESISDGTNTLNVVTRDTSQYISGPKTFSDITFFDPISHVGTAIWEKSEVGADSKTIVSPTGGTAGATYNILLPARSGTLAIRDCYTEAEALAILDGSAE